MAAQPVARSPLLFHVYLNDAFPYHARPAGAHRGGHIAGQLPGPIYQLLGSTAPGPPAEAAPTDTASVPPPNDGITPALLARHIQVLASDEFQGRRPFTAGEEKATRYLASEFKKLGLKPGPNGSYFQAVPLVEITGRPDSTATIAGAGKSLTLKYRTDYMFLTEREKPTVEIQHSPLVFAGYGVVAPECKWDDYAGLDVQGKTVVVLINDPGNAGTDTTLFKGRAMTYYDRWGYKYEEAARHGATGLLIIHDTKPASYPWTVVQSSNGGAKLHPQTHSANLCVLPRRTSARKLAGNSRMIAWPQGEASQLRKRGHHPTLSARRGPS